MKVTLDFSMPEYYSECQKVFAHPTKLLRTQHFTVSIKFTMVSVNVKGF